MTHEFKTRFEQNDCVCWLAGSRAGQDLCVTSLQPPPPPPMTGRFTRRRAQLKVCQKTTTSVWFCWAAPSLLCDPSPVERKNKTPCFFVSKWMWRAEMRWGIVWSKSLLSSNGAFTFSSKLVGFRWLALWDSLGFWEASITTGNIFYYFFFSNFFSPLVTDYTNQQHLELISVGGMVILECSEKNISHLIWQTIWVRFLRENCLLKCWHLLMKHKPFVLSFSVSNWTFLRLSAHWGTKKPKGCRRSVGWRRRGGNPISYFIRKGTFTLLLIERDLACVAAVKDHIHTHMHRHTYTHMHRHTPPVNQCVRTLDFFFRLNSLFSLL